MCADEPRLLANCGAKPTYHPTNTHILAVGSSLVLFVFGMAMVWYCWKICLYRYGLRVAAEHVPPIIEYQMVNMPTAEALSDTQSDRDDPPSYDSLYKRN